MLQNLLKDRFGLTWLFQEKKLKGYHLVIAKDGPKLNPSTGASPAGGDQHRSLGQGESHNHSGAVVFGSSASYRAANQTIAALARVLSDQIGLPVDDETGLAGSTIWPSAGRALLPAQGRALPCLTRCSSNSA
jgi:uncharacterized protein (TIGR03435 family)